MKVAGTCYLWPQNSVWLALHYEFIYILYSHSKKNSPGGYVYPLCYLLKFLLSLTVTEMDKLQTCSDISKRYSFLLKNSLFHFCASCDYFKDLNDDEGQFGNFNTEECWCQSHQESKRDWFFAFNFFSFPTDPSLVRAAQTPWWLSVFSLNFNWNQVRNQQNCKNIKWQIGEMTGIWLMSLVCRLPPSALLRSLFIMQTHLQLNLQLLNYNWRNFLRKKSVFEVQLPFFLAQRRLRGSGRLHYSVLNHKQMCSGRDGEPDMQAIPTFPVLCVYSALCGKFLLSVHSLIFCSSVSHFHTSYY